MMSFVIKNGSSHGMRNKITASKQCCVSRPHKQISAISLADGFMEISPIAESANSMKDGLEPFHWIGAARCASRGLFRQFGDR